MGVEWHFLCADCKIEIDLHGGRWSSLWELDGLSGDELRECAKAVEKIKGFQKGLKREETVLDRLEMLLALFPEHRDHGTLLYDNNQDVEVEYLPWFERWSWREDITALEPTAVAKEGWERGLPLGEAVGSHMVGEQKKGKKGVESEV